MKKILPIVLAFFLAPPLAAFAGEITVAAAANVQFTLDDLKAEFTRETGVGVKTVIGSSGKLTAQTENGAPFDVFLSADMKYPSRLYKDGFSSEAPKVYAYGVLVLWTMEDLDLSKGVNALSGPKVRKIALANPDLAPYGRQAVNALKFYKLYDQLQKEFVLGESISQTNQFITTGATDIGFTAESIVLAPNMKGKGKWVEVDPQSYKPIAQGVVVLKYGKQNHLKDAEEFYNFLFFGPGQGDLQEIWLQLTVNKLTGKIVLIETSPHMSMVDVDVDGDVFTSIVLEVPATAAYLKQGNQVTLVFKETEVSIAKNLSGLISLRNRFKAAITRLEGSDILTKVFLNYKNKEIISIISTRSAQKLALAEGDEVEWLVKTNEVSLLKE